MISKATYDALLKYQSGSIRCEDGATDRILNLIELGYLEAVESKTESSFGIVQVFDVAWAITIKGEDALTEFEQESQKQSNAKRQQRFQNKIAILNILVPFVTFLLGLFVEHFTNVAGLLLSLIH